MRGLVPLTHVRRRQACMLVHIAHLNRILAKDRPQFPLSPWTGELRDRVGRSAKIKRQTDQLGFLLSLHLRIFNAMGVRARHQIMTLADIKVVLSPMAVGPCLWNLVCR
jgi:hypothetical protein